MSEGAVSRIIVRLRWLLASLLALVMIVSLSTVLPPAPAAADAQGLRAAPEYEPVPHKKARPKVPPVPAGDGAVWQPGQAASWPKAGRADLAVPDAKGKRPATAEAKDLALGKAAVGGAPVRVAAPRDSRSRADVPAAVRVELLDREVSDKLGVSGPVFTVSSLDDNAGEVGVSIDYSDFAELYGGDWSSRLRLVTLPACALTDVAEAGCSTATPVKSTNNGRSQQVFGQVTTESTVVALAAEESSPDGDYKATDLSAAGSWEAGGPSGAFTYAHPMRVPPAEGQAPGVALAYDSQSIDGQTNGKNNQAAWTGDGWTYTPGYVERSYQTCAEDQDVVGGTDPNNTAKKTGDLCWFTENATISLNGTNATLVKDADTGKWRVASDGNWRVELLTDGALTGYDKFGQYWRITTPDGTKFYFGGEPSSSSSTWTAPVFGNHPGEPCYTTVFKNSSCKRAWRWNLDKSVDRSGNVTRYHYSTQTGAYGAAGDENNRVTYVRGGHVKRIEYGLNSSEPDTAATARVLFTAGDRCFSDCHDADGDPKASNWPDVPWDQNCDATPCTEQRALTFWTPKRLAKVTTQVRRGTAFSDVESWTLNHEFRKPGDGTQKLLWLRSITHAAHVGGTLTSPPVTFTPVQRDNRVDELKYTHPMTRLRIGQIRTESGADIHVTYSEEECVAGSNMPSSPQSNAKNCYPVYWTPEGQGDPVLDWFHKYVVAEVTESDLTGGGPMLEHTYSYSTSGGGTSQLWAYDDNEFTKKKHRTYSIWRGYPQVTTLVGDPAKGQLKSTNRYYRGMHGQPLPNDGTRSVSITDSEGNTVTDHRALAGQPHEELSYNGGTLIGASTHEFWTKQTASRSRNGVTNRAYLTGESVSKTRTRLATDTWRRVEARTTFDDEGYPTQTNDLGDTGKSGDELCTRITYVNNASEWIRGLESRSETVSKSCGTMPSRPADVVGDVKTYYDGSDTHGTAPTKGRATRVDELHEWDGGPKYLTASRTDYDKLGRAIAGYDAKGRKTTTAYTPAGAGPVTKTVTTNPAGHAVTTYQDPAFAQPTAVVDANGKRTDLELDPVGRLRKVWLAGRVKGSDNPHMEFSYLVRNDGPLAVTSKALLPGDPGADRYDTSVALFDSLYRPVQTQERAVGGGRLVSWTLYNERGETQTVSGPNHTTGDPGTSLITFTRADDRARTENTYDNAGRLTVEAFFSRDTEKHRTTTTYGGSPNGWQVAINPPKGATSTASLADARGNVTELREFHGGSPSGTYDRASYTYTPRGELKTVADAGGNTWRYTYDLRGQRVETDDPDKGITTTEYDATGQVVESVDARDRKVSTTYDALDRPTARWEGAPTTGTKLAAWTYDTVAKGQLTRSSSFVDGREFYSQVFSYSDRYQPTFVGTEIPAAPGLTDVAGKYAVTSAYLDDGSVRSTTFGAIGGLEKETLNHAYDAWGNVARITGSTPSSGLPFVYLDSTSFSPFGEVAQRNLGDAGKDQFGNTIPKAQHTYLYEEDTRRLSQLFFDRTGSTVPNVANLSWAYDPAGNVLSLADLPEDQPTQADAQCFTYDHLRRMTEAWTQPGGACAAEPSRDLLGGPAPYWKSYQFRKDGSRTKQVDHSVATDVTTSYTYPATGEPQPRAIKTVDDGTGDADTFTWDPTGNLQTRTRGGDTDTFTWNATGKPVTIATQDGTARMYYNADGDRIARVDADGSAAAFVFGQELTAKAGTKKATRYYSHAGTVYASRTTGADLYWLASDHHGTADWAINNRTKVSSVKRRDPFGIVRGHDNASIWPGGQHSFVGGTDDPTGLIQLGARPYDPTLGAFLAVDPLMVPSEPQRMHPYAYGNNAPATFMDPSGLALICGHYAGQCDDSPGRPSRGKKSGSSKGGSSNSNSSKSSSPTGASGSSRNPYYGTPVADRLVAEAYMNQPTGRLGKLHLYFFGNPYMDKLRRLQGIPVT